MKWRKDGEDIPTDEVREMLERWADGRTYTALAGEAGTSIAYVSQVMNGKKEPGPELLKMLGVEKRVVYRSTDNQKTKRWR